MGISIDELKKQSGLPGPRGNLELLYQYIGQCSTESVAACLDVIRPDTSNSPEEFVGMCGVAGFALVHQGSEDELVGHLVRYARHASWRIRESVAVALQELPVRSLDDRLRIARAMQDEDPLVCRAIVAGLCEPKNLRNQASLPRVYDHLNYATARLDTVGRLTEGEEALKKALGYGWSVVLVEAFDAGRADFENLVVHGNKNLRWIARENLKKNRLARGHGDWVAEQVRRQQVKG